MAVDRVYGGTSLIDVLDRILDKGLVIDVWARVSVVGLEVLTVEARVVVASVDTYLRYAHAIGLTPLASRPPVEQSEGALDRAQRGHRPGLLAGTNGQGDGGSPQGVSGQLHAGGAGNGGAQPNGGPQEQGVRALPAGLADQLRSIIEQLEQNQNQAQPAPAGQSGAGQ